MKRRLQNITLFIISLLLYSNALNAQGYTVEVKTSQTYTELTGDIDAGITPTNFIGSIPAINTNLKFFNSTINLQANPFDVNMALGALETRSTSGNITQIYAANGFPTAGHAVSTSKVSYTISSDWLKVQFKDVSFENLPATEVANYQIWVNLKNNSIEFHYGLNNISSATPIVGLAERKPSFSTVFIHQLEGDPNAPTKSAFGGAQLTSMPANGTVYVYKYNATNTGIISLEKNTVVKTYPNPTHGQTTIDLSTLKENVKSITVFNQLGKQVMSISPNIENKQVQLNMESLPKGIYHATIITEKRTLVSKKIVLQ
jgi:hypothetical protein